MSIWVVSIAVVLLYGCGAASKSEMDQVAKETLEKAITEQGYQNIKKRVPFSGGNYDSGQASTLKEGYQQLAEAYASSGRQDLPPLHMMVISSYLADYPEDQRAGSLLQTEKFDSSFSAGDILAAIGKVKQALPQPGIPNFLGNHQYLEHTSDHHWKFHYGTFSKIHNSGFGALDGDFSDGAPLVADASGNPVLTGLEDEQWYFYGQGYAFRGHWETISGLRQEYKGEGAELGLFSTLGNGLLLGGMFGFQKVRMTFEQGGSDADIYRIGPFLSWSSSHWALDAMVNYGWVGLKTRQLHWQGRPDGSEWAAHAQLSYSIFLDDVAQGLRLVPEVYAGFRLGDIPAHEESSEGSTRSLDASRQKGLTARIGSGLVYTLPDLSAPTEFSVKVGLQKTHGWQEEENNSSRRSQWPDTPLAETRETAIYYGLGCSHRFGADKDKLLGLDYLGLSGDKSGSDALTLTYRQKF